MPTHGGICEINYKGFLQSNTIFESNFKNKIRVLRNI